MSELKNIYIKLKGYLKKRTPEQLVLNRLHTQELKGLYFKLGRNKSSPFHLSYHPDSYFAFREHLEFDELFQRFTDCNKVNNGGDSTRLWAFILNCKQVMAEGIKGDFAELGVWRGNTASILANYAATDNRKVLLFDTFEGFKVNDLKGIDAQKEMDFNNTSIELVGKVIGKNNTHCIYVKGFFPDSIMDEHRARQYAIVSLDCDLYAPTKAGLAFFYERMPKGGIFFLHDYSSLHWNGAKLAIDEFCKESGEYVILMPDKSGSAFLRKNHG